MPVTFGASIKEGKVYRGKRNTEEEEEKRALAELQSLLNSKNRRACDCEAQLHDLLENCLNCGRLTCVLEGPGKCFFCGNLVVSQEQRDRLKKYVDLSYSYPTIGENNPGTSPKSKVKIIDNQFDQSAIENQRHLRESDKSKLKDSLKELQSRRYQTKLVLNVDLDKMEAGTSTAPTIDYAREIQRLQISGSNENATNSSTLAEALNKERKPTATKSNKNQACNNEFKNKNKRPK